VSANPGQRKPARPVVALEHIHATYSRQKTNELNPYDFVLKRLPAELSGMINEANRSNHYVHPTDNCQGDRTDVLDGFDTGYPPLIYYEISFPECGTAAAYGGHGELRGDRNFFPPVDVAGEATVVSALRK
jgi:hypothetical protein